MVGRAAAEFTAQWEFPAALAPTRDEATAFVREYEAARGRAFTADERVVVNAAATISSRRSRASSSAPTASTTACCARPRTHR